MTARLRSATQSASRRCTRRQVKEWGDRHINPGAEPIIFEHSCGAQFHPLTVCTACREPYRAGELTVIGGTHPVEATM